MLVVWQNHYGRVCRVVQRLRREVLEWRKLNRVSKNQETIDASADGGASLED